MNIQLNFLKPIRAKFEPASLFGMLSQIINSIIIFGIGTLAFETYENGRLWLLVLGANAYVLYAELGLGPLIQRFTTYASANNEEVVEIKKFSQIIFFFLAIIIFVIVGYLMFDDFYKNERLTYFCLAFGLTITMRYRFAYSVLMGLGETILVQKTLFISALIKLMLVVLGLITKSSLLYFVLVLQVLNISQYLALNYRIKSYIKSDHTIIYRDKFIALFMKIWPLIWRTVIAIVMGRVIIEIILYNLLQEIDKGALAFLLRYSMYVSTFSMTWLTIQLPKITLKRINKGIELGDYRSFALMPLLLFTFGYFLLVVFLNSPFNSTYAPESVSTVIVVYLLLLVERVSGIIMHIYSTVNKEPWYLFMIGTVVIYFVLSLAGVENIIAYLCTQILMLISILLYVKSKEINI